MKHYVTKVDRPVTGEPQRFTTALFGACTKVDGFYRMEAGRFVTYPEFTVKLAQLVEEEGVILPAAPKFGRATGDILHRYWLSTPEPLERMHGIAGLLRNTFPETPDYRDVIRLRDAISAFECGETIQSFDISHPFSTPETEGLVITTKVSRISIFESTVREGVLELSPISKASAISEFVDLTRHSFEIAVGEVLGAGLAKQLASHLSLPA